MKFLRTAALAMVLALSLGSEGLAQTSAQLTWGKTSGGSANAQTVTIPNVISLPTGVPINFIAGFTNTGPMTLNISGTGAQAVQRAGLALGPNQVIGGTTQTVVWNGTTLQLVDRI